MCVCVWDRESVWVSECECVRECLYSSAETQTISFWFVSIKFCLLFLKNSLKLFEIILLICVNCLHIGVRGSLCSFGTTFVFFSMNYIHFIYFGKKHILFLSCQNYCNCKEKNQKKTSCKYFERVTIFTSKKIIFIISFNVFIISFI